MKLLMVTPYSPYPPTSGGRIRQWEQVRYFARRHDVTVAFFREPPAEVPPALAELCRRVVPVAPPPRLRPEDLAISEGTPWSVRYNGTVGMYRALQELHPAAFDAVLVDSIYMALYRDLFPARAVLQEQNIESQLAKQLMGRPRSDAPPERGPERLYWGAVASQMETYENRMWPLFPLRVAVSHQDKAEIERRCTAGRTIVVENGADVRAPVVRDEPGPRTVLLMGALDYLPNVDAAHYLVNAIMPAVWARAPDVALIIAGRGPDRSLSALCADPRVRLVASPADMRAVAAQASVSAVPLRVGAGTRLKILESLAWGVPVVSTALGCEGLALDPGRHLVVRDDPASFADAIVQVLSDAALWRGLSSAGRAEVERRYAWEPLLERFEDELCRLVARGVPATAASPRAER